jgi:hypothetical protein
MSRSKNPLSALALADAAATLSHDGEFLFTPRNLYYELIRRGAWPAPSGSARQALLEFRRALGDHQRAHHRIDGLIRAHEARAAVPPATLRDVFDYSVRRVLVFDRVETFLLFAMNGFHRKIEVALLAHPDFPAHVARRLERQLAGGLRTAFYTVHDASRSGSKLRARTKKLLLPHGKPRLADVGLSFAQAFRLGIPVRMGKPSAGGERGPGALEEQLLLASGNYAHVEEMPPLALMRWVYERIARGPDDLGFG